MVRHRSSRVGFAFIWNLGGNSLFSLAQWFLLVILARLADPSEVGRFALILAITAPISMTTGLNIRTVIATDVGRVWTLREFTYLRAVLNLISIVVTGIVGAVLAPDLEFLVAIFVMALAKAVESTSALYYGYFQFNRRLDYVSQSLIVRAILGPSCFYFLLSVTDSLPAALSGLLLGWLSAQLLLDRKRFISMGVEDPASGVGSRISKRRVLALARRALPLGLDQGASSLVANTPRYAIEASLGTVQVGIYASLSYLTQVINMITSSMAAVVLPSIARAYHGRQFRRYLLLIGWLCAFSVAIVCAMGGLLLLLSGNIISSTLGPEFTNRPLLVALLVNAGFISLQRSLSKGLEASHKFKSYLAIDVATLVIIAALSFPLITAYGIVGAAIASICGNLFGSAAFCVAILAAVRSARLGPSNSGT